MQDNESEISASCVSKPRWRWMVHLLLLTAYPLVLGILGARNHGANTEPMLPTDIKSLLKVLALEATIFGIIFAIALAFSRPERREMFLAWRGRLRPVFSGLLLSIGLRFGLMVVMLGIAAAASAFGARSAEWAQQLQPDVEEMVNAQALVQRPAYFVLTVTLVSFVFGGLREELWRAGMFAGFRKLLPGHTPERTFRWIALVVSGVVFGIGHLPQGWGGVLLTGLLGIGLGMIILRSDSIWPSVFAHGFFDAATFLMLFVMVKFPALVPKGT